jgi:phosphotransferase system enzyme I (PtsP)
VLLELLKVPALIDVAGLFRWASDGDIAVLDADHGLLIINPSRAEISKLRHERAPGSDVSSDAKREETSGDLLEPRVHGPKLGVDRIPD